MAVRAGNTGLAATDNGGITALSKAVSSRGLALNKPTSSEGLVPLIEALLHDAPGIVLIVDVDGWLRGSSAAAHSVWPSANSASSRVHDLVNTELASEWLEHVRQVIRDRRAVAIRGVVKGEWLWTLLRAVEVSSGTVHVMVTIRAMTADAIHTPPVGIGSSIRITDAEHHDLGPMQQLSKREIEVLSLVGAGLTTGQIAKVLHRSLKTVENHRTSIGRKLNARSLLDLCRMARHAGMPETTPIFAERAHGKGENSHSDMMDGK